MTELAKCDVEQIHLAIESQESNQSKLSPYFNRQYRHNQ